MAFTIISKIYSKLSRCIEYKNDIVDHDLFYSYSYDALHSNDISCINTCKYEYIDYLRVNFQVEWKLKYIFN